jgi:hypothetical protein
MRRTVPALIALLAMLAPAATLAAERYRCAAMGGQTMSTPCCPDTAAPERTQPGPELRRLACCDREPASISDTGPRFERPQRDLDLRPGVLRAPVTAILAHRAPPSARVPARAGAPPPRQAPAFLLHSSLLL